MDHAGVANIGDPEVPADGFAACAAAGRAGYGAGREAPEVRPEAAADTRNVGNIVGLDNVALGEASNDWYMITRRRCRSWSGEDRESREAGNR